MPFAASPEGQEAAAGVAGERPRYSLVIPVYRNEENIPDLIEALLGLEQRLSGLEVVFVVDGSPDRSAEALSLALEQVPFAWQLVELSRNFGSFAAIRQGLALAQAPLTAVMAADLQEPPELIEEFFRVLATGSYDLAVGVRAGREDPALTKLTSSIYWSFYRRLVMRTVPSGGVDIFACNARFREALLSLEERNSFLIGQLFWLGFRRFEVPYRRRPRLLGQSAWKLRSRLRYMLDSIFAFSDLPISILLWLGAIGSGVSVGFSIMILFAWSFGLVEVRGYVPTMLAIMFFGSLMVLGQGIIGCYVWRVAENTKKRPLSLILSHRTRPATAGRPAKAVSS
jgi:glycosyltransferase involved in cell wall biosynthesis